MSRRKKVSLLGLGLFAGLCGYVAIASRYFPDLLTDDDEQYHDEAYGSYKPGPDNTLHEMTH